MCFDWRAIVEIRSGVNTT